MSLGPGRTNLASSGTPMAASCMMRLPLRCGGSRVNVGLSGRAHLCPEHGEPDVSWTAGCCRCVTWTGPELESRPARSGLCALPSWMSPYSRSGDFQE